MKSYLKIKNIILIASIFILILALSKIILDNKSKITYSDIDDILTNRKPKITDLDVELFHPLFSGNLPNGPLEKYLGLQKNNKDYINFFTNTGIALEFLIKSKASQNKEFLEKGLSIIDNIEKTFDNHGCFPRPAYHQFEYGWVSSMDAPLISLTSLVAFELTGQKKYYDFYIKLLPYLTKTCEQKGFLLELSEDALYPLEYCDTNTNEKNAMFVLNGSLVGYLSLAIISNSYKSNEINLLLKKINKAYEIKFPEFIRHDKKWTFYMLNKPTQNEGHYHIFEMKLFNSIFKITKKKIFKHEYEMRQNMLKEIYDLKIMNENDSLKYFFLRSTAPHPYAIELYGTILKFYDKQDNLIHKSKCLKSGFLKISEFKNSAFMTGTLPKNAYSYELISIKNNIETLLFKERLNDYVETGHIKNPKFTISASGDAKFQEKKLTIDSTLSSEVWASLMLTFDSILPIDYLKYYYLELNNGLDNVIMQLTLYDSERKNLHRYIPKMIKEKNLILFSPLGFHSKESIKNISRLRLKIHTESKGFRNNNQININNFGVLENEYDVIQYLNSSEYLTNSELN
mgnify:CR=1 FL=1